MGLIANHCTCLLALHRLLKHNCCVFGCTPLAPQALCSVFGLQFNGTPDTVLHVRLNSIDNLVTMLCVCLHSIGTSGYVPCVCLHSTGTSGNVLWDILTTIATPMGLCFNEDESKTYKWAMTWHDARIQWGTEDIAIHKPVCWYLRHVLVHKAYREEALDPLTQHMHQNVVSQNAHPLNTYERERRVKLLQAHYTHVACTRCYQLSPCVDRYPRRSANVPRPDTHSGFFPRRHVVECTIITFRLCCSGLIWLHPVLLPPLVHSKYISLSEDVPPSPVVWPFHVPIYWDPLAPTKHVAWHFPQLLQVLLQASVYALLCMSPCFSNQPCHHHHSHPLPCSLRCCWLHPLCTSGCTPCLMPAESSIGFVCV